MTDPRFTDPRNSDPPLSQSRRGEEMGGMWGWIAGLAAIALVAFIVIAGWNSGADNTAANIPASGPARTTTGSAPPPSTTGSGATAPRPATPQPPPANNGAR